MFFLQRIYWALIYIVLTHIILIKSLLNSHVQKISSVELNSNFGIILLHTYHFYSSGRGSCGAEFSVTLSSERPC